MTIRERIADWLTSGALTRARDCADLWCRFNTEKANALVEIAALETPKANATVRKMARIAREASHG